MKYFLWNLLLALLWANVSGEITFTTLATGGLIGFGILFVVQPALGYSIYFKKVGQSILFVGYFIKELLLANLRVAHDVLTPTNYNKPGVIAIELDARTDWEITLLANLISLTPGTLSLDVSNDKKLLYIHAMFIDDPDELRNEIKNGLERRLLEVLR